MKLLVTLFLVNLVCLEKIQLDNTLAEKMKKISEDILGKESNQQESLSTLIPKTKSKLRDMAEKIANHIKLGQAKEQKKERSLKIKIKTLKKMLTRNLMVEKLLDTILVPDYNMNPTMMALQIPQIQDPRMVIQTFNPPTMPLEKGMLPDPHFHYTIELPQKEEPEVAKEINLVVPEKVEDVVKNDIKKAFIGALSKFRHMNFTTKKEGIYRVNVFNTATDRVLREGIMYKKINELTAKLSKIKGNYKLFKDGIQKKLKSLKSVTDHFKRVDLKFIA